MIKPLLALAATLIASHAFAFDFAPLKPLDLREVDPAMAKDTFGAYEIRNKSGSKRCRVVLTQEQAIGGYAIDAAPDCAKAFPIMADIAGWTYSDNDLLHFVDPRGKSLVEFSEVESGMYEAPTPGFGVLFLQNSAETAAQPVPLDQVTGDWALMRGAGKPLCTITLLTDPVNEGFAVATKPDCDPSIARLKFLRWRLDRDELVITPTGGNVWRFEQEDANTWARGPESANPYRLVRQ
jgi:hypothetical protein